MEEILEKERRLRDLLASERLDALLLKRVSSFAWATGGAPSYVSTASETGEASLLFLPDRRCLLTNVIEAPRLEHEHELGLGRQGWEVIASPWHEANGALERLTVRLRLGADGPLAGAVDLSHRMARLSLGFAHSEPPRTWCAGGLNAFGA